MTAAGARSLTSVLLPLSVRERLSQPQYARVVIVPDGALQQLPFEALMWPAGKDKTNYVLDHSPPIAYAPSARILTVLRERDATATAEHSLLTVGKTTFETRDGTRSPLPAAKRECAAVAEACRRAGFSQITSLLDTEATEGGVRRHCAQAGILHFATHAIVDQQRDNCFGRLELTPSGDDGYLELHEIHGLSLTACDLAVLSACETNVGPDLPLEAGSTLARAFFAAGARRVVCSLWEVPDDSTSRLIAALFENLQRAWTSGQGVDYAAALHQARQSLRREADHESPYYWAPFVLIGRPKMP
jgi:CHAT domain-containing protein